ncbi:MAG TPA: 2OG-Fe(II) oxygenase family protein [Rhodopila sp.]|uniref:isopenicillin N synthase family dioxygenase n=1 Tax=Rhodopila sp. TaxID=2480087 RepID=UPI002C151808|nr:2OG-Fe(II) oxygenase family protein [Rhodopila sp.]HVY15493.1 2OG-Fe(II) oxygenase family protein [Rhodopila sp.]
MAELPIIRFAGAGDPEIAAQLDATFRNTGFCYFADIGIDPALTQGVFAASRRFHALPRADKDAIAMNRFHRGYMAPKSSIIETSSVAQVTKPNDSESFMLMHEVAPDDPRFGRPLDGPNQWPALPSFREPVEAYERAMHAFCLRLLRPMALALGLPDDWLLPFFQQPTTFLRLLHYPPQAKDAPDDAFGSAPHTDYGFITILAQDDRGGLEVRRSDGTWLPAPPIPGTWVVNVADMLSRWTNGRWQSTPHRVKNLSGGDRYSCPYFFDMAMDSIVDVVPTCRGADNPPPVRYGDYLMERLDRNYAYRKSAAA